MGRTQASSPIGPGKAPSRPSRWRTSRPGHPAGTPCSPHLPARAACSKACAAGRAESLKHQRISPSRSDRSTSVTKPRPAILPATRACGRRSSRPGPPIFRPLPRPSALCRGKSKTKHRKPTRRPQQVSLPKRTAASSIHPEWELPPASSRRSVASSAACSDGSRRCLQANRTASSRTSRLALREHGSFRERTLTATSRSGVKSQTSPHPHGWRPRN